MLSPTRLRNRHAANHDRRLKDSIDLGLAVLAAVMRRGDSLTCRDIADVCECSKSLIQQIEKSALRKVRHRLKRLGVEAG